MIKVLVEVERGLVSRILSNNPNVKAVIIDHDSVEISEEVVEKVIKENKLQPVDLIFLQEGEEE